VNAGVGRLLDDSELEDACAGKYQRFRTGFVVGCRYALTACHCVPEPAERAWLEFRGTADRPHLVDHRLFIAYRVHARSSRFDVALLRRDGNLPAFDVDVGETPPGRYRLTARQVRRALRRRRLLLRPVLSWRRIRIVAIEGFPAPFENEQSDQAQLDGRTLSGQLVR
jgi:hypothetical protein